MLQLPAKGFQRSVTKHNVDLSVMADWVEASSIFHDETVTGASLVDLVIENHIYSNQDFAWELVNDAISLLKSRAAIFGQGYPVEISSTTRIQPKGNWQDFSPYCFCLTLSLCDYFPQWARAFGKNFTTQGQLFEDLTKEAFEAIFDGWTVLPTGWTRTNTNGLNTVVTSVANALGESTGQISRWTREAANDAGLDLVCYRRFRDGRVGFPAFFVQCASGCDWPAKLKTPDLRTWTKIIQFASDPKRGFSTPFAMSDHGYTMNCNLVDGLLLDRHRLLSPGENNQDWVSGALKASLEIWIGTRIASLPSIL